MRICLISGMRARALGPGIETRPPDRFLSPGNSACSLQAARSFVGSDLRYAWRSLWKSPATSVGAMLALALGIGATTTIFGLVNAVLLRPLPYPDPDRIVEIFGNVQREVVERRGASFADYFDWRTESRSYDAMAMWMTSGFIVVRCRRAHARQRGNRRRSLLRASRRAAAASAECFRTATIVRALPRGRDCRARVERAIRSAPATPSAAPCNSIRASTPSSASSPALSAAVPIRPMSGSRRGRRSALRR